MRKTLLVFTGILIFVCFSLNTVKAEGENLIPNPGFEETVKEDPLAPESPKCWLPRGPENTCVFLEEGGHESKHCVMVKPSKKWSFWAQNKLKDIFLAGNTYRFSAWMKADKPGVTARIVLFRSGSGDKFEQFLEFKGLTTEWKQYSRDYKIKADCRHPIDLWLLNADTGTTLYFDDVSVTLVKK